MFPFIDTAPRARPPAAVLAVIALNSLTFLWMWSLPPRSLHFVLLQFALIPERYTSARFSAYFGLDPSDWWPLLTNTFMHGGWFHLLANMWFLWIFGPAMEARLGRIGFLILYLGGGAAASFVHLVTHAASAEPVLGASGAIAAVIAAYAVTYPTARIISIVPIFFIPLLLPIPALLFAAIWFGLQVVQGTTELAMPALAGDVAWWAHIGGFAFGIVFVTIVNLLGFHPAIATTRWQSAGRDGPR